MAEVTEHATPHIIIVSGLPRSGTSMMMRMLEAGGVPVLTDGVRKADSDNALGYYEFEPVKTLKRDSSWLPDAYGRAVKMVYLLLYDLPATSRYKVIFMHRNLRETLASQQVMLARNGNGTGDQEPDRLIGLFQGQLRDVETWLSTQDNFDVLYVDYNGTLQQTAQTCGWISAFLGVDLDEPRMKSVVDQALYRQRLPSR
jgi:hypothetical protein